MYSRINLIIFLSTILFHFVVIMLFVLFIYLPHRQAKEGSIFQNIRIDQKNSWEDSLNSEQEQEQCTMASCFNFSKCINTDELLVYVYPALHDVPQSQTFSTILKIVKESRYFTEDPNKACLFIPNVDTTDRDEISVNFLKNIDQHMSALPKDIWSDGQNHLIFNFYFGTYPNYANNNLGFNHNKAMIAWTSSNWQNFRYNFDVAFPLFHKEHALKSNQKSFQMQFPGHDKYLMNFKGKRYVYGVGSETRDILHHLNNNKTIVMATTCRHNTDWKKFEDERCEKDNIAYGMWDYDALMKNSTFCLVPRGRRLGSFRFLESLRSSCIPVLLSDDWVLPFEEIIDWSEAAIFGSEKNVLFIHDYLSRIPEEQIHRMRQNAQLLYENYFSSVEKIILTTIEVLFKRIKRHLGKPC